MVAICRWGRRDAGGPRRDFPHPPKSGIIGIRRLLQQRQSSARNTNGNAAPQQLRGGKHRPICRGRIPELYYEAMTAFHAKPIWSFLLVLLMLTGQAVHFAGHALHFIEEQRGLRCQEVPGPHSCTGHERLNRRVVAARHAADQLACPLCQGQSYDLAAAAEVPASSRFVSARTALHEAPVLDGGSRIAAARGPPSAVRC